VLICSIDLFMYNGRNLFIVKLLLYINIIIFRSDAFL